MTTAEKEESVTCLFAKKHYKGHDKIRIYEKPGKQLFGAKEKLFLISTVRLVLYVDRFRKDKKIKI
jgi:hypothetical protein